MTHAFSDEQMSDIKDMFNGLASANGDKLPISSLFRALRCLGQYATSATQSEIVEGLPADGLDFSDFLVVYQSVADANDADADLIQAFHSFDEDGSGVVSFANARLMLTTLAGMDEATAGETIAQAYAGGSEPPATIDFDHFVDIVKSL